MRITVILSIYIVLGVCLVAGEDDAPPLTTVECETMKIPRDEFKRLIERELNGIHDKKLSFPLIVSQYRTGIKTAEFSDVRATFKVSAVEQTASLHYKVYIHADADAQYSTWNAPSALPVHVSSELAADIRLYVDPTQCSFRAFFDLSPFYSVITGLPAHVDAVTRKDASQRFLEWPFEDFTHDALAAAEKAQFEVNK